MKVNVFALTCDLTVILSHTSILLILFHVEMMRIYYYEIANLLLIIQGKKNSEQHALNINKANRSLFRSG